jgi:hypothetical protein
MVLVRTFNCGLIVLLVSVVGPISLENEPFLHYGLTYLLVIPSQILFLFPTFTVLADVLFLGLPRALWG